MVAHIPLTRGLFALVDDEDFEWLSQWKWGAQPYPHTFYATRGIAAPNGGRAVLRMHRLILGAPKGLQVDHANGDGLDNRRENLRLATQSQNNANARMKVGASGFRGVYYHSDCANPWQARIWVNGRSRGLGFYSTRDAAARAYDAAALEVFGDFARLNFELEGVRSA